jgi:hypothetical protein
MQEVLMARSLTRARPSQSTLFQAPQPRPQFQTFPQDIQDKTIRLLARLLCLRADRMLVSGEAREGRHE